MNQCSFKSSSRQAVKICPSDRWQTYQRLQELSIPCCSEDGHLWVEIDTVVAALQLRSVIQQLTAPRRLLTDWLERCWHIE